MEGLSGLARHQSTQSHGRVRTTTSRGTRVPLPNRDSFCQSRTGVPAKVDAVTSLKILTKKFFFSPKSSKTTSTTWKKIKNPPKKKKQYKKVCSCKQNWSSRLVQFSCKMYRRIFRTVKYCETWNLRVFFFFWFYFLISFFSVWVLTDVSNRERVFGVASSTLSREQ